jgi:hypothetical protein
MDIYNTQNFENEAAGVNRSVMDAWQQAKNKHDKAYQSYDDMGNINELVSGLTGVATQAFNKLGAGAAAKAYLQTDDSPTNILGRAQDYITNTLSNKPLPSNTSPPVEEGSELQNMQDEFAPKNIPEGSEGRAGTDVSEDSTPPIQANKSSELPDESGSTETSFGGEAGDTVETGATTGATEGAEGAAEGADAADGIMGTIGEIGGALDLTGIGSTVGLVLGAIGAIGTGIEGLVQLIEGHHKQAQNTSVNLSQLPNVSFTPGVN